MENAVADRLHVLINRDAGSCNAAALTLLERRAAAGLLTLHKVDQAEAVRDLAASLAGRLDADAVVAGAGGDGTASLTAQGLFRALEGRSPEKGPAFGIVPLGTANDTARGLGLPLELEAVLTLLGRPPRTRPLDLLRCRWWGADGGGGDAAAGERVVLNAASGGFVGELHEVLNDDLKQAWGGLVYVRAGAEVLHDAGNHSIEATLDGVTDPRMGRAALVLVNNGPRAGGQMVQPEASMWDGLMDAVFVDAQTVAERLRAVAAAVMHRLSGGGVEGAADHAARVRRFELVCSPAMSWLADGEPLGDAARVELEVLPAALRVVVPKEQ